jgi:hypothetical protein
MVDHNFRDRPYRDTYNEVPDRSYPDSYRNTDYPHPDERYDRPGNSTFSRRYYDEPRVEERRTLSNASYDPAVDDRSDRIVSSRPVAPGETVSSRGYSRRNRIDDPYRAEIQRQSDIQEVHRSNNIAIGLLLGVLLTSIIGILGAIFYFATTEPEPATVQPAPTQPQTEPAQPQTTTPDQ